MIFSAGLGSRLRRLTNFKPKALIEINSEPMPGMLIKRLTGYGFNEIINNVHHFAQQIIHFLKKNNNFGATITISDKTSQLFESGGGLKNAAWFFNDKFHNNNEAQAALVVRKRESTRDLLFDNDLQLCGRENRETQEVKMSSQSASGSVSFAFGGIQFLKSLIF